MPQIVILGGGVGGAIVANRLARRLRRGEANILLVDASGQHVYQPGLLYLPFGQGTPQALARPLRRLLHRMVELLTGTATAIDTATRTVHVNGSNVHYDWLVLATGARLTAERIPGFAEAHHFYDLEGAVRLRYALQEFRGGRIVVGPARKVYKCPPAPLEFVLLLDDELRRRGIRDRTDLHYISPFPDVFHGKKIANLMGRLLDERGIRAITGFNLKEIRGHILLSHEGHDIPFDLAALVPPHRVATVAEQAGLAPEGWVPVDAHTLRVAGQERILAIGDTTSLPIPKTGAVTHFQAPAVVQGVLNELRGRGRLRPYSGQVLCLIETGAGRATVMRFDYDSPARPSPPSRIYHWAKVVLNRAYWAAIPSGRI